MVETDSDIPSEYTSSIGAIVWPPEKASFERKKGIYPRVLESNDLNNFLAEFACLEFDDTTTRISGRAVVSRKALENINVNPNNNFIETLIPLSGCGIPQLEDCVLVYFGKNHQSRIPPSDIVQQQLDLAKQIFNNQSQQQQQNNHDNQFSINLFDPNKLTAEIFQQYTHLYSIFGWTDQEIEQMLTSPSNIIIYAQNDNNQIVSSVLGEKGTITVVRGSQSINLSLVEITEAATLPSFRGKGLYQKVSDALLNYLGQRSPPPHLVFGELNLNSPGVLKVAARQKRVPAWQTAEEFGLPNAWFLPQHVTIYQGDQTDNQRPENYRYNNLMVAFLTQKSLLERSRIHF